MKDSDLIYHNKYLQFNKNPYNTSHKLHYVNPCSVYSPLSAHTYLSRYAKNHGKDLLVILDDVSLIESRLLQEKN